MGPRNRKPRPVQTGKVALLRWLRTGLATVLWGYLLVGMLGVIEAVSQWLRFDLLAGQPPAAGPVQMFNPTFVLYGWFGLVMAFLLFGPAFLLVRQRTRPQRLTMVLSLSGTLATLLVIYVGYLGRTHLFSQWWGEKSGILDDLLLALVWVGSLCLVMIPVRRLARRLTRLRSRTLVFPIVLVIVTTSLWPDWPQEGLDARTGYLERQTEPAMAGAAAPANLILISIDTLRRDRLSILNPNTPTTPNLDRLAAEGMLFSQAWSTSPWTLPSMGTVMTGLPPRILQVERYRPLPETATTLAEIAWSSGYQTAAFTSNAYLTDWYGFDRGFAVFEHALVLETFLPASRSLLVREATRYANIHLQLDRAEVIIGKAIAWLCQQDEGNPFFFFWTHLFNPRLPFKGQDPQSPFFLWIHLMDPHLPYRWHDLPQKNADPVRKVRNPRREDVPDEDHFAGQSFSALHEVRRGEFIPDESQREAIRILYDREVQYADHCLGLLFTQLEHLGFWDRTLVVVVADHGEELFEHGGFEHGHSVLPEVTAVPLIIRLPEGVDGGRRVHQAVSILDLVPTVCQALGWPEPPDLPGRSCCPWAVAEQERATVDTSFPLLIENLLYGPQQTGIVAWPYLCVKPEVGVHVWYDLVADPRALQPIPAPPSAPSITARVDSLVSVWQRQAGAYPAPSRAGEKNVPRAIRRQLRALGY